MTTTTCKHRYSNAHSAGFSIVELMVTLCIAAILFAVAIPSFRQMMASNRLSTQTNDLIGAVNYARSEAITRNRTITLCRTSSEIDTVCSGTGSWTFWIVRNDAGEIARRGEIPTYGGNIVVQSTLTADTMVFGSDGLARTNGALVNNQTIMVCADVSMNDNRRRITMGSGSRVITERLSGTGACT
jgi:type IV fimbrial biogenesis protein FimT